MNKPLLAFCSALRQKGISDASWPLVSRPCLHDRMKTPSDKALLKPAAGAPAPADKPWLVRIPNIFSPVAEEVLERFKATAVKRLGADYYMVKVPNGRVFRHSDAAMFAQWNLPMEQTWPCNPQKMENFIEKAAQTLLDKFEHRKPQMLVVGRLNAGSPDPYYKHMAMNLRGRMVQVFPPFKVKEVEEQDPTAETLFCLVGKEGLYAGMQSPRECNGFYAGGSKFVGGDASSKISRAGGKLAEALHYLLMYRPAIPAGRRWLELGACPGGMTSELLARGYRVTAVDRTALDKRLDGHKGLTFVQTDVQTFEPKDGEMFDAVLSDLSGDADESIEEVARLAKFMHRDGTVIFTLKVPRVESVQGPIHLFQEIVGIAQEEGLRLFAHTHLTYNGHEFTLFFERGAPAQERRGNR